MCNIWAVSYKKSIIFDSAPFFWRFYLLCYHILETGGAVGSQVLYLGPFPKLGSVSKYVHPLPSCTVLYCEGHFTQESLTSSNPFKCEARIICYLLSNFILKECRSEGRPTLKQVVLGQKATPAAAAVYCRGGGGGRWHLVKQTLATFFINWQRQLRAGADNPIIDIACARSEKSFFSLYEMRSRPEKQYIGRCECG